ncbi:hydrogenase nickel incorporation protein HypB [Clostridium sp. JN-9]|uniref:hydrogenase nickel incorporation protein HypB n=1 Tax=Clostridium sp. JN-9 TaxID=2507159 RepID=UPI000FFE0699|nr:hydrogenase nickel incorporation protein HypB [Clostridium sp. JN-9]QAT39990.1 hydrogenase accessory protein HypB [Clostridium sp. JN-9]
MEIKVVRQILEWNENCHDEIHSLLNDKNVLMINVMGSPGGGKTTLIMRLVESLKSKYNIGVIEGDIAGVIDAEKIAAMGIHVVQLNTEGACHIEAMSIKNILPQFDLDKIDILIVENIGNLVCPAEFDIGEDLKIALLSVPEGDDKVEKYPLMFTRSNALVINKYDMKAYFNFDENRVIKHAKAFNKDLEIFPINSINGDGFNDFLNFIEKHIKNGSVKCNEQI